MKELNEKEKKVMQDREMEAPFSGLHYLNESPGIYSCKQCGEELFYSEDKFHCGSGWPAFDDCNEEVVKLISSDEKRGKVVICSNCEGFLGTFIEGEEFTPKNRRYNINSIALSFSPRQEIRR